MINFRLKLTYFQLTFQPIKNIKTPSFIYFFKKKIRQSGVRQGKAF